MAETLVMNEDQSQALAKVNCFFEDPGQDVFILCGSAGTGKTTLLSCVLEMAISSGLRPLLLAPTGRAVRIARLKVERSLSETPEVVKVSTIHGSIFYLADITFDESAEAEGLPLVSMYFALKQNAGDFDVVVVDEASMIGNGSSNDGDTRYGSGQLLNDLMRYLGLDRPKEERSRRVKLMFVGDMAQLPPVRGSESPALSLEFLQSQYDIRVQRYELTTVVRQTEGGDVLNLAYEARQRISAPEIKPIADSFGGQVYVSNFRQAAIDIVSGINQGKSVMAVVRTNAQVSRYNMTVRRYLWGRHCMNIMQGDTLLVVKNNPLLDLPNGELVQVVGANLKQQRERLVGHNGCEVQLNFRGITIEISNADGGTEFRPILVLENLLYNNRTNLSQAERWALVELVHKRHRYISKESEAFKALLATDPFYNALQVKFGYALTCHKAQGGEWSHVIVDLEGKPLMTQNDWRWFYTAVTRSKEALSLVNLSACNWVEANQRAS